MCSIQYCTIPQFLRFSVVHIFAFALYLILFFLALSLREALLCLFSRGQVRLQAAGGLGVAGRIFVGACGWTAVVFVPSI